MANQKKIDSEKAFELVQNLIRDDSEAVDKLIRKNLRSDVTLISQVS